MLKFNWNPGASHISQALAFFNIPFLQYFWSEAGMLNAAPSICTIMERKCPQTWRRNRLQNNSDCIRRFAQVPQFDPECPSGSSYAEGYSQACRHVHASFALLDDRHCPHLSFEPQADYMNRTKCQASTCTPPETLFTAQEINSTFARYKRDVGIPVDAGFAECSCDTEYSMWRYAVDSWADSIRNLPIVSFVFGWLDAYGLLVIPRPSVYHCAMCYGAGASDTKVIAAKHSADRLLGQSSYCSGGLEACWWRTD